MIPKTTTSRTKANGTLSNAIELLVATGLLLAAVTGVAQQTVPQQNAPEQTTPLTAALPLSSKSPVARHLVEEALSLYLDHVEQPESIEILRKAVQVDPDFAMGHEFLAQISLDSAEQVDEQKKAFAT